jgi:hypothetical protein
MGGAPDGNPFSGGGGDDGGGGGDQGGGGPMPPDMMQMMLAAQLAPQVLAQQQMEDHKRFLQNIMKVLRDFMRTRGIGPKTVSNVGRSVTGLQAAMGTLDKEKPEEAEPVNSLLGAGMMGGNRPQMAAAGPMNRLPVSR